MFCWLFGNLRFCGLPDPIVLIAETCAVQALDDMRHGVVEVVGGSQHIGHIECALRMLARMGQTENPSQNLLHVNLTCLIGKGRKNIGKGAVPALFQRIDRDNISDRAVWGHQLHIFQLVHIGGTNGNLIGRNPGVHQLVPQFFKGGRVLLALRLCLKQRDRTDIFTRLGVLRVCDFFQLVPQVDCISQYLGLAVPVIDDHRQLDHVFVFQLHRVHIGDDIALLFRRGGQIQHKAGIEVFQHFKAQFRPGMVALVHDDKRVKLVDDLEQSGFVRFFNGAVGLAQHLCKRGKIAVFLIGFQALLTATAEGIIGQHHNRQLLRYGRGVEVLTVQKLLLGVDLHTPAEIHVDFLAVGMGGVFQGFRRLCQNRVRWNKPHDRLCLGSGERVKDRANGVAGNEGFAAACRYLEAEIWNTGYHVLVSP